MKLLMLIVGLLFYSRTIFAVDCGSLNASLHPIQEILDNEFIDGTDSYVRLYCLEVALDSSDRRDIFLTMYVNTTKAVHAAIEAGEFEDNAWVDQYLTAFANLYREAFLNFEKGQLEVVPSAWRLAFEASRNPNILVTQHLLLGVNAHVNYDLALALSQLNLEDQREKKYRDHTAVNKVLRRIVDEQFELVAGKFANGLEHIPDVADRLSKEAFIRTLVLGREAAWKKASLIMKNTGWIRGVDLEARSFAKMILAPQYNLRLMAELRRLEQEGWVNKN